MSRRTGSGPGAERADGKSAPAGNGSLSQCKTPSGIGIGIEPVATATGDGAKGTGRFPRRTVQDGSANSGAAGSPGRDRATGPATDELVNRGGQAPGRGRATGGRDRPTEKRVGTRTGTVAAGIGESAKG